MRIGGIERGECKRTTGPGCKGPTRIKEGPKGYNNVQYSTVSYRFDHVCNKQKAPVAPESRFQASGLLYRNQASARVVIYGDQSVSERCGGIQHSAMGINFETFFLQSERRHDAPPLRALHRITQQRIGVSRNRKTAGGTYI